MAQTYQITISTPNRVAVTVTSEDAGEMKAGLTWAKEVYKHLVDNNQGQKDPQDHVQEQPEEAPICAVHHIAMVRQRGKFGAFWSCHQRTEDGSFCSYKPE